MSKIQGIFYLAKVLVERNEALFSIKLASFQTDIRKSMFSDLIVRLELNRVSDDFRKADRIFYFFHF